MAAGSGEGRLSPVDRRALRAALEIIDNEVERVSVYGLPHGRVMLDEDELRAVAMAGRAALARGADADAGGADGD